MFFPTDDLRSDEIYLHLERTADADLQKGWVPAYHFAICLSSGEKIGLCDLRVGHNENLYFGGNIGYEIFPEHRGHHYAGKACRLLFRLAKKHTLEYVIITCNPENAASARTCEYAGGQLLEIAELPPENDMREKGETHKRIYKFEL